MDKPTLLLVDDEVRIVRALKMIFHSSYRILTALNGHDALKIIQQEHVHVIVSDQRMPKMLGAQLLHQVKECSPHTMRILLTGYSDLDAIVDSINEGEIFRFVSKPWDQIKLKHTVDKAARVAISTEQAMQEMTKAPTENQVAKAHLDTKVLIIDADQSTHQTAQAIFSDNMTVFCCASLDEGLEVLSKHNIAVVVTDIRVGGENITNALNVLREQNPYIITIVLTSIRDTTNLINLINHGQVFRFLPKPARRGLLTQSVTWPSNIIMPIRIDLSYYADRK